MKIGLALGKFLPFHQGHELYLQTAAECVDKLIVLIGCSDDDPIPLGMRMDWVEKAIGGWPHIICGQKELDKDAPKDKDGTITDENYWNAWLVDTADIIDTICPDNGITHVFTSDAYGQRIAKEFGAQWYPIDPEREIIDVSGTRVRNNLNGYFHLLPPYVRKQFVKKVALVGPESTGKSVLSKELGKHYSCPWVPEYGRTVCKPRENKLTEQDFDVILYGQDAFIRNAVSRCTDVPLVISDTEALVTATYYDLYYPDIRCDKYFDFAKAQDIDLYLVMAPSVPWVQDGDRVMTEAGRWQFYYALLEKLREWKKPFQMIEHSDFTYRTAKVISYIDGILK